MNSTATTPQVETTEALNRKTQRLAEVAQYLSEMLSAQEGVLSTRVSALTGNSESSRVSVDFTDGSRYAFKITEWRAPDED